MRSAYWQRAVRHAIFGRVPHRIAPVSSLREMQCVAGRVRFNPRSRQFHTGAVLHEQLKAVVPPMAESISEGTLASFSKKVGDSVNADEEIASIETDKIDFAVTAPGSGVLTEILIEPGDVVREGQEIASIETSNDGLSESRPQESIAPNTSSNGEIGREEIAPPMEATRAVDQSSEAPTPQKSPAESVPKSRSALESGLELPAEIPSGKPHRTERTEKLSRMRQTIAKRLKDSQNRTASLTTIQQVDMSAVMAWRQRYKDELFERHGVKLGYMGIFTKAATIAAGVVPEINASIDTDLSLITFRDYVDISIAVSTPRGLVTPVVRNCEMMNIIEIEKEIGILAKKARDSKLTLDDISGGNFSISNPGIFGSYFGTPLINYPQSAVFNMNGIREEPVVVNGKIEIRPMMFITLTYDHRLIDGREAVTFLNTIKGLIEDPAKITLA